jgi:hypothetical protein
MNTSTAIVDSSLTIRFEQVSEQTIGDIKKIAGLVKARNLIPLINALDLEANPRSSKVGPVTQAIRDSIEKTPSEFPFKTKGILLGAMNYKALDRGRVQVAFNDLTLEGILDGGHNMLAIGMYILRYALPDEPRVTKVKIWDEFRDLWDEFADDVLTFRERSAEDPATYADLDFYVPVELVVPSDVENPVVVDEFRASLLDICAARNNNVQLKVEAKANQSGYFDDLRSLLPKKISDKVEWKTNDGGSIKAADIVALTWIPLSVIENLPLDDDGKKVEPPVPQNIYRSKGDCMNRFERLMSSEEVFKSELRSPLVHSGFKVAASIPELYDYIYANFPLIYNAQGGKYGRIVAVKKMNPENNKPKYSKFTHQDVDYNSPEGFIVPLVYGLKALIEEDGGTLKWKTDPLAFLKQHLPAVVRQFTLMMAPLQYDPQKVGKAPESYTLSYGAYDTEYLRAYGS